MSDSISSVPNDSRGCVLREQVFHDPLNGLTIQIEKIEGRRSGDRTVITLLGPIPHGNRSYIFNSHGVLVQRHTEPDASKIGKTFKR